MSGGIGDYLPAPPYAVPGTSGGHASVLALSYHRDAEGLDRGWPLRDSIELGALTGSAPCARYHARQILWEWGLSRLSGNVELVLDELVANAVAASRRLDWPFPVRLWLLSDTTNVLVVVWDANLEPPVRMDPADDAEGGRGLLLVEAVSTWWGWYALPDADRNVAGKITCALITV